MTKEQVDAETMEGFFRLIAELNTHQLQQLVAYGEDVLFMRKMGTTAADYADQEAESVPAKSE